MADNTQDQPQGNIRNEFNTASTGLNMDQSVNQIPKGSLTYALNANMENFDANSASYQNEPGNEFCLQFPTDYILIGSHFIQEKNKHVFFITNPLINNSQIGYMDNNDCIYHTFISAPCLNFDINYPINKVVHKITNCTTEIYWTDGLNPRRYLDLNPDTIPYILAANSEECNVIYTDQIDCNQLNLQPNFNIPNLEVVDVVSGGNLTAGTVQFAIQYADASGNPYTSYYSVTNPTPIADTQLTTPNFNYNVGKSVILEISNLDSTGQFQYYNLAVIKTVNAISSVELAGTYFINNPVEKLTYTGQNVTNIRLAISDIFEKQPYYEVANDLTSAQDILIWSDLTSVSRVNYQSIANQISLQWETWRIPATQDYSDELNATNLRGYLRDEVYALEICFLLKNGKQTDGFHIPGRIKNSNESYLDVPTTNDDFIGTPTSYSLDETIGYSPYWKIYNTASVVSQSPEYVVALNKTTSYRGPYEYGQFAYWESEDLYPCVTEIWGDLAGQPIRHHKFPDVLVSPIFEERIFSGISSMVMGSTAVFPMGIRIDVKEIGDIINSSALTTEQKNDIVGFKILRGDRGTNKSIVAKGILRNVGEYKREEQSFYFPNYPYNDLNEDPFLTDFNNKFEDVLKGWLILCSLSGEFEYTSADTGLPIKETMVAGTNYERCSLTKPTFVSGRACIGPAEFDAWNIYTCDPNSGYPDVLGNYVEYTCRNGGQFFQGINYSSSIGCFFVNVSGYDITTQAMINSRTGNVVNAYKLPFVYCDEGVLPDPSLRYSNQVLGRRSKKAKCGVPLPLIATANPETKYRQIFNSPETSFGQPFLGNVLKLENVIYGKGQDHFVQVRDNAKYRLLSKEAQTDALGSSFDIAPSDVNARFTAYQAYLTIYINGITRKNYAYSYNSRADYNYKADIDNNLGIKQREIDIATYLIPGVQSVGDNYNINNFQRESSVFIKTIEDRVINDNSPITVTALEFPSKVPDMLNTSGQPIVVDRSRTTISSSDRCSVPGKEKPIEVVSYYASLKNVIPNQWGQIYTYKTIDTGFQRVDFKNKSETTTIFGGDTFISRFAFKTKLPFFIDNRVNAPDDSDIFYDEIGNVAYPKYWHSARSILETYLTMINIISYKAHNFDCPNDPAKIITPSGVAGTYRTYYDGYFYLFAYGVPNFYCETSYNLDLRQAFNNKEGDFWPHVSTGIPDDWVQESYVSIANDNTYTYNTTFSKQNTENVFTHLPDDYKDNFCLTNFPFRTIYSELQNTNADSRVNNWLIYKPLSFFDFPQNYGALTSLDGIQNKAVLARFENKTLLYNNLLTVDTSNPQAAYFGNPNFFRTDVPPIDFAETDLGYIGSQNKFLLKIPQGQITVDAKRGQVFLIEGTQAKDLSAFGSGMNRFFTDHLAFEILRYFPETPIDNHFTSVGLHGVYDSKFDRVIISKLDYIPIDKDVKYDVINNEYYIETVTYIDAATTTTSTSTTSTSSTTTTTTTTICNSYLYAIDLYNCLDCTVYGSGQMYNAVPLTVGAWYIYLGYKAQITQYLACSLGGTLVNIVETQQNSCVELTCATTTTTSSTTTTTTTLCCVVGEVTIGSQVWSTCNLDITSYNNGDVIPEVTDPAAWASLTTGAWCYYNNDPSNNCVYGKLYNWYAVNDPRGFAPVGYHVPSNLEYITLATSLGGFPVAGGAMKETGTTHWLAPNTGATNSSGFTGLPSGARGLAGNFSDRTYWGYLWSSAQFDATTAWCVILSYGVASLSSSHDFKKFGFSVRVIKD
jgi:uncharacterized protein (TIGR02145 family)